MTTPRPKVIVLDDDPTGSQTVHSCLLLMQWDIETLRLGLRDSAPIFFILTNTRALSAEKAAQVTEQVCQNLKIALSQEGIKDFLLVSRSDSTLRGHYPVETDVIASQLGPFDAHFLIPAFFEGGRITIDSIHYLIVDGVPTPVHETEFAKDSVFAYHYSYLPDYVEEKTGGKIQSTSVEKFSLADIRCGSKERLLGLHDNQCAVVDAQKQSDLDTFAGDLISAATLGKRFLLRSAASILTSLAQLGKQPLAPEEMARYKPTDKKGAAIVGSHVKKTSEQLQELLKEPDVVGIELNVSQLRDHPQQKAQLLAETLQRIEQVHRDDKTPVIYTSRQELQFDSVDTRLEFGMGVSSLLMDIVRGLPHDIAFLISKGGITSNDVLSDGLNLQAVRLMGQILPGCSMVRTESDHPLFANLPVVLFPGNVGDSTGLATVYRRLNS
ncbi:MAG: hypothetical protein N5P05_001403 [Chroococcopsis gigantea SAG 12.99]|jgi:uncharacterized protein YgbK (DUF1537 family)|nr:four-carbon acid sugar kinase family protein [Chlorogloea purpurea SAG 13.99]MDV2999797.1 hypothetical protein [Chroococcopsis gigantea SAG 12.99]